VSTETMRANQMRLYLSGVAYVLVSALRRLGLAGTELERAQALVSIEECKFAVAPSGRG
jgi:hypothetical protein